MTDAQRLLNEEVYLLHFIESTEPKSAKLLLSFVSLTEMLLIIETPHFCHPRLFLYFNDGLASLKPIPFLYC